MLIEFVHGKESINNEGEFVGAADQRSHWGFTGNIKGKMLNSYRNGFDANGNEDLFMLPNANVVRE